MHPAWILREARDCRSECSERVREISFMRTSHIIWGLRSDCLDRVGFWEEDKLTVSREAKSLSKIYPGLKSGRKRALLSSISQIRVPLCTKCLCSEVISSDWCILSHVWHWRYILVAHGRLERIAVAVKSILYKLDMIDVIYASQISHLREVVVNELIEFKDRPIIIEYLQITEGNFRRSRGPRRSHE